MNFDFFIKNSKFAYLFLVALIGVGAYSIIAIPKESAPEVVIPVGVINTILPGAPAADIETLVTNEIERGLTSLEDVKKITSTSREGVSVVVVEFNANADLDKSIQDLKDQVDTVKRDLPADAEDPFVTEVDFVNQPILSVALAANLTDFEFATLAEAVEKELELISGVSRVEPGGVRERAVTVLVDQSALARFNLSLNDVVSGIRNANVSFPIGQITTSGVSYNIAFEGDIATPADVEGIPIAAVGGQPVYVRDIAIVEDGLKPATTIARLSIEGAVSQNSITFNVYKQAGGDITQIASAVNNRVAELKQANGLLDGIETVTVLDSGEQIRSDLLNLTTSGLQTVVLVVLLLVIAIGWREGLLAGTAIPLSFLFGFIGLYFSGNTINFLSLFSLILGIGILVDSAIVMVEGINRKMKDDPTIDKRHAALAAIKEFAAPLISGTLTTVAMFSGLFIVSGVIGQFIASIPFTLIFLLLASLFVALAIVPLFASILLKRRSATGFEQKQVAYAKRLEVWYIGKLTPYLESEQKQQTFLAGLFALLVFAISLAVNVFAGFIAAPLVYLVLLQFYRWNPISTLTKIGKSIARTIAVLVTAVVPFVVASFILPPMTLVDVTFFEQGDVDYVIVEIEQPEGTVKEVTDIAVRRVEEVLFNQPNIESYTVTVGSGSQFGSGGTGEKYANIFVSLKDDRTQTSTEFIESLRTEFLALSDLKVTINQPSDGPPTGAAVIVKFLGDDLSELTTLANTAAQIFRTVPGAINVESSTNSNNTEFLLTLDKAQTAALGLNPLLVSQTARAAVFGTDATSITTITDDVAIIVRLNLNNSPLVNADTANATSIDALERILIPTMTGPVPLSSLVTVTLRESSSVITHEEGQRVVTITADVSAGFNARAVQAEAMDKVNAEIAIPNSVVISTGGGETDESNQAFIEMFFALVVGIALMVGILVLQFNSYLHMQYVLSILPFSLIGIFAGLAITQNSLSFPSMMGFIALSGIVVNNSILLIDMMNQMRKRAPERPIKSIVIEVAGNRLRPILLTTLTTVIGMIPLAFAGDLWAPLAYAVMFGLVFSVVITLVLIPIVYLRKPGELSR